MGKDKEDFLADPHDQRSMKAYGTSTDLKTQVKEPPVGAQEDRRQQMEQHPLAQLSSSTKHLLLVIFSIAQFVDVCNVSGVAIAVADISSDIQLGLSQLVWIITSYSLCFASFLLLAGRLADLFPSWILFEGGFAALGIFSLITSFVTTSKYGFLILRGLGGICGAMTIPSSYYLVVQMFPDPAIAAKKLSLLGLAGAIGNVLGLVLAGLCMLSSYRWFFRLIAIICLLFSALTFWLLPRTPAPQTDEAAGMSLLRRMDIPGVVIMTSSLVCFILALTQGPIDGWGSASFIAPFIIGVVLAPIFFVYESRIPAESAVLPSSIWKISNIVISSLAVLYPFSFWGTSQLQYSTFFQEALGWSPIHVAAAMLPQGIIGLIVGGLAQAIPGILGKPRITIGVGATLIIIAEILQVYSDGGRGMNYWKFCFPAYILGSSGAILSYFASAINLISYCPPEMAGVASAWTQVLAQIGAAIALAVQAGLQGTDISNWKHSSARGFWFMVAWAAVLGAQYVIFYKQPQTPELEHELARQRIKASKDAATSGTITPVEDQGTRC